MSLATFFCVVFSLCPVHVDCPSLVSYSRTTQAQVARELRALPPGSATERLLADYHRMRDACRASNL